MIRQIFIFFSQAVLIMSCNTSRPLSSSHYGSAITGMAYNDGATFTTSNYSTGSDKNVFNLVEQRKVIYNAYIDVTVKKVDTFHVRLTTIAKKYDGYAMELGDKQATIRVKAERLNDAIKEIAAFGKLTSQTVRGNDITEDYQDVELRLDNAMRARKRYLELLEKASTVEETLKVEKELERLGLEIELLEGRKNKMDHLTTYSTIHIDIRKKKILGPLGYVCLGLYKAVKLLFVIK